MKIGIVGLGNMGSAMAHGLLENKIETYLFDRHEEKRDVFKKYENAHILLTDREVVEKSDAIIVAIKPYAYDEFLEKVKDIIDKQIIISITSSFDLKKLEEKLKGKKFLMALPNTPAKVMESMTGICPGKNIEEDELKEIEKVLSSFGKTKIVSEKDIKIFESSCGCMPAYVYMFIEAAADACVYYGMKRDMAYECVSQAVMGAAKMVNETKEHPGVLKDQVTTSGGTTIKGLKSLEESAFRASIIDAIESIMEN